MLTGQADVDIGDVLRGLESMQRRGRDLRPLWREVRPRLRADIGQHFASREGPAGGWSPYSQATLDRLMASKGLRRKRVRIPQNPLTRRGQRRIERRVSGMLGRLRSAFEFVVTRTFIEARSLAAWAGVHQHGGTAGRGARIPARTFAWASYRLIDVVRDKAVKLIAEAM